MSAFLELASLSNCSGESEFDDKREVKAFCTLGKNPVKAEAYRIACLQYVVVSLNTSNDNRPPIHLVLDH